MAAAAATAAGTQQCFSLHQQHRSFCRPHAQTQQQRQQQQNRPPQALIGPRCRGCGVPLPQHHTQRRQRSSRLIVCASSLLPFAALAAQHQAPGGGVSAATTAFAAAPHALPALLSSAGILILCCAAAALLLAGIPLLWSLTRAANRMESMMQTLEMELPDTAASIRLSSLEMSDCMSELGALGSDLTGGIQSAARMVSATEAGVRQGAQAIGGAVVPALAQRETRVRDVLEAALRVRAELAPQIPKARRAVAATTATARKLRTGVALTRVAAGMFDIGRAVRRQFTIAAAQQVLQQYADEQRAVRRRSSGSGEVADDVEEEPQVRRQQS